MATRWKKISSKIVKKSALFSVELHDVRLPSGKVIDEYLYIHPKNGAIVIALTNKKELILISQYRYAVNKRVLTLPGGLAEARSENLATTAKRELLEETGYRPKKILRLGTFYPMPGTIDQHTDVFLATGCTRVSRAESPDETESLQVKLIPLQRLPSLIGKNTLRDSMSLAAVFLYIHSAKGRSYGR